MRKLLSYIHNTKSANLFGKMFIVAKQNIDPVILFMVIMHFFDFGIVQSVALCLYIIYKITYKRNFNSKVTFS